MKRRNVIDCHQHIGSIANFMGVSTTGRRSEIVESDASLRRAANEHLGIGQAVVQPSFEYRVSKGAESITELNDATAAYVRDNGFAATGFGVVDPLSMDNVEDEVERAIATLGLCGLSWHARFQRIPTNAPAILRAIDACPSTTRVIAVHCVGESRMEAPWRLSELMDAFPNRAFLALSSLTAHSQCDEMIDLCHRYPNLYIETAGLQPVGLWIEKIVTALGSERLLFGSDLYVDPLMLRHNYALEEIEASNLREDDRENILRRNAIRLFGLNQ
jgi:predicted TIM-barrel fold metal-dependent hydrolase